MVFGRLKLYNLRKALLVENYNRKMKIISKYKDFYDYLAQDYDADIVYPRNARWCGDLRLRKLYMANSSYYKYVPENKLPYNTPDIRWNNCVLGDIEPEAIAFGVYPFVYSTPILKVYGRAEDSGEVWRDPFTIYPGRSFVDSLKDEENVKVLCKKLSDLTIESIKKYNKENDYWWAVVMDEKVKYAPTSYFKKNIYEQLSGYAKKVECREIFDTLGSPVFIEENELIDFYHSPFPGKDDNKKTIKQYLVDLSFTALDPDIIKYWYSDLADLNTYNYIENFLWSQKHEVASEQTNNEKILSHGFDLKTSFRKM